MKDPAFAPYFVDHTAGVYPTSASGMPYSAASMEVKGDPMADLVEDLAADGTVMQRQPLKKSLRCNGFLVFDVVQAFSGYIRVKTTS